MTSGITLVLGGLGVKGIAHVGTLQALAARGVAVRRIVAGGIAGGIAAHAALGGDLDALIAGLSNLFDRNHARLWGLERFSGAPTGERRLAVASLSYFLRERLFCRMNLTRESVLGWEIVDADLKRLFGDTHASDLRPRIAFAAFDLTTWQEVLLEEGRVVDLVKAAAAFPGLLPPVRINDRQYVSSTLFCELPLGPLGDADRPIVAVDIPGRPSRERPASLLEVLTLADEARGDALKRVRLEKADHILRLDGLSSFHWGSYRRIPQLVLRAREEVEGRVEAGLLRTIRGCNGQG
jgi:NTE family protein